MHTRTTLALATLLGLALLPQPARGHSDDVCAGSDHCAKDAQCNDGDPCTRDFCEAAGQDGCCEHEPISPCLDTFLCYDLAAGDPGSRVVPIPRVGVTDPFGKVVATLTPTRRLCAPVDRGGAGIHDPRTNLASYQIAPRTGPPGKSVTVETALGAVLVDVVAGDSLLTPATRSATAPPPLPGTTGVDDLKCAAVKPARGAPPFPKGTTITLARGLTTAPATFRVAAPVQLCTAADVAGDGYRDACAALLCYRVKPARGAPAFARVDGILARDRFALRQLAAVKEAVACLPAVVADHTCSPRGFFCQADLDCSTGHCADGVCCESACDGPCEACAAGATGQPHGVCAPLPGPCDEAPRR